MPSWPEEKVLVVPRAELFRGSEGAHGFSDRDLDSILERIGRFSEFRLRAEVEEDSSLKQVIPYVMLTRGDDLFLLKRLSAQSEARLHNLYSIGVGGHINPVDEDEGDPVAGGMERELAEEVDIQGRYDLTPVGYLNDDSNPVGSVHFGLVYRARVESGEVEVAEKEMMEGRFVSPEEAALLREGMETWSQLLFDAVRNRPEIAFPVASRD
ncbi:MAG: NUDIX domain-containing protein [Planctomycetota bacterium]|jgi:predicted NUDIX family phosphoesterase